MKKLLPAILLLILAGCGDNREIGERATVTGVGVDVRDGTFFVSMELADMSDGEAGDIGTHHLRGGGMSMSEAVRDVTASLGRELYLGHTQAVVLGPGVDGETLRDVLNYFRRDDTFQLSTRVLLSECPAEEALFSVPVARPMNSYELIKLMTVSSDLLAVPDCTVNSFFAAADQRGTEAVLPLINVVLREGEPTASFSGSVVFRGFERAVKLDRDMTAELMMLRGQKGCGMVSVALEEGTAVFSVLAVKSRWRFEQDGARLTLSLRLSLIEAPASADINKERLEKAAEQSIEKKLSELYAFLSRTGADGAGVGREMEKRRPALWESMPGLQEYPVRINARVKISFLGRIVNR